jgi:hypothetical protein
MAASSRGAVHDAAKRVCQQSRGPGVREPGGDIDDIICDYCVSYHWQ